MYDLTAEESKYRAAVREYAKQIRAIRHKHFGDVKIQSIREAGISLLREFTDPAAFAPMIEELKREKDDVRLAVLDHFAQHGDEGQAALAFVAIYDESAAMRNEALRRMVSPASEPVRYVLNGALRSTKDQVANAAANLAGSLNVIQTIPLLIFAQATATQADGAGEGDLAWVAFQTQRAFVAGLQPVVGDASGAFQPIMGVVSEGVVLRVMDAVVISYRTEVHDALVNMTTSDWGQPTEPMGYNIQAWWDWYDKQYVPYKNEQAKSDTLAGEPPK